MPTEEYAALAAWYDRLTNDVEYPKRAAYLDALLQKHSITPPKTLLDLACGSGSLTWELARLGYEMIGVDRSEEMLAVAMAKPQTASTAPLWLCQDMRELDLYGTVDAAVCTLDGFNHLLTTADIAKTLDRLRLFIGPHGLLIFDVNTPYKHREVLGDNSFIYELEDEDVICCWRNRYTEKTCRVDMYLDFFIGKNGLYDRRSDEISERAYTAATLKKLLNAAGFETVAVYRDMTEEAADDADSRWVFVTRNTRKEQDYE